MEFSQLVRNRRTIRFFEQRQIPDAQLLKIVDDARSASCACNWQRLRYTIVRTPDLAEKVFAHTAYGGKVTPRRSPRWGVNAPAAFIIVHADCTGNSAAHLEADAGAAIQTMEFSAWECGLGCCWLGAINKEAISELTGVQNIIYLVAVGYPAETPVAEDVAITDSNAYYLDENDTLHVPKINVNDLTTWL
jgi:nitroreductase